MESIKLWKEERGTTGVSVSPPAGTVVVVVEEPGSVTLVRVVSDTVVLVVAEDAEEGPVMGIVVVEGGVVLELLMVTFVVTEE